MNKKLRDIIFKEQDFKDLEEEKEEDYKAIEIQMA